MFGEKWNDKLLFVRHGVMVLGSQVDSYTGVNAPKTHSGQSRYAPRMTLIEGLPTQLWSVKQKGEETSKQNGWRTVWYPCGSQ